MDTWVRRICALLGPITWMMYYSRNLKTLHLAVAVPVYHLSWERKSITCFTPAFTSVLSVSVWSRSLRPTHFGAFTSIQRNLFMLVEPPFFSALPLSITDFVLTLIKPLSKGRRLQRVQACYKPSFHTEKRFHHGIGTPAGASDS